MKMQGEEEEYKHNVWETYRKEWATANREKQIILNKRMRRWQELMRNGWTAQRAYYKATQEESDYGLMKAKTAKPPSSSLWSWMRKIPSIILISALVVVIFYGVFVNREIDTLKTELDSVQSELAPTQLELSSTKQILASTQTELASTQTELDSTQVELDSTQTKLDSTQTRLSSTKQKLSSVQQDLTNLQATLSETEQQLAIAQETLGGLGISLSVSKECEDNVDLIDNPTAINPTWSQLMAFLSQDQTETHEYILNEYDCSQFSRDVHNNAEEKGIRAAVVHAWFRNEEVGHALNAFLTTDYGLVYVDCTGAPDKIARVKAGKEYREVELYKITRSNIRNDFWWDNLSSSSYVTLVSTGRHHITSDIKIYW